ncbi:threonine aldolase family protein [Novosphingobium naphthalenivorans]|uniref:threonine aldolase family protein n=1 Tax=Novosphingobium naphthalenivorans TaxID=273168 RepID=UPI000A060D69|nr:beta-eliminating lyase-related protein [Novosphingobium naphthalenivorans]
MNEAEALAAERTRLRLTCRHLAGHGPIHPAEPFEAIAAWLRENGSRDLGGGFVPGVQPDVYGTGALVEDFEAEIAALFDMPAARFMPSGCMAQPIALRIWSDRAGNPTTAFHPTSHLELHEEFGYRELHGLSAHLVGDANRPTTAGDVIELIGPGGAAHETGLASLLVELPAREIGGQLPSWEELVALSELCRDHGIRLHLDGARVWQAAPAYGRSLSEIAALFDSVYVSFYKDVGALAGAMLLGPREFVDEAAIWQRRQGGTLHSAMANIISARLNLAGCLERMPLLVERARQVAALFSCHERASVIPDPPHTSMFHLRLEGEEEQLLQARDRVARETGIWLFGTLKTVEGQAACQVEISMGKASLALENEALAEAIALLF